MQRRAALLSVLAFAVTSCGGDERNTRERPRHRPSAPELVYKTIDDLLNNAAGG